MKNITLAGGITRDAKLNSNQSGSVLNFSVAVDHRDGREKTTMYFDCALWGKRGEALEQYLTKGTRVAVSGDLSTREHDGKTYLRVNANEVTLLGGGQPADNGNRQQSARQASYDAQRPQSGGRAQPDFDDEIPF